MELACSDKHDEKKDEVFQNPQKSVAEKLIWSQLHLGLPDPCKNKKFI